MKPRIIAKLFIVVWAFALTIFSTVIRLIHPELTETQLALNYWVIWIGALVIVAPAALVIWRDS